MVMDNVFEKEKTPSAEQITKVRALYEYLLKFSKLRQHPATNLNLCRKKAIDEFPEDPVNIKISYCDTVSGSEVEDQGEELPLLVIHKPDFEKCPELPPELTGWLANGWNSFCCEATAYSCRYKSSRLPVLGEIGDDAEVEYFDDSPRRQQVFTKWMRKRIDWVNRQKSIDKTRRLFETFYNFHMEMQRDSDNLELVIANGFFESASRADVSYPVLSKKVKTKFSARKSEIYVYDGDSQPELYTDAFEVFDEMHLEHLSDLNDKLAIQSFHPLDRNETPVFLKEVINTLTPHGFYNDSAPSSGWKATYKYVCYWKPVYVLRARQDGSIRVIEKIVENINQTGYVPPHIAEIVEPGKVEEEAPQDEETFVEKLASIGGESAEILLAKEANREQLDIAKRIERNNAVVVQGPPGTGKTHTIANLLGHFLAQGKSVLVTSFTTKALKVLKKKVPEKIQPLCVSVIDDDKAEMMRSVNGITDWMARITSTKLRDQMTSFDEIRRDILRELGELRNKLFSIRHQECQIISYCGESLSPSAAAKFVADNESKLNYIPGEVAVGHALPLTIDELTVLYRTNVEVTAQECAELSLHLPDPTILLSPDEFETQVAVYHRLGDSLDSLSESTKWSFSYDVESKTISLNMGNFRSFIIPEPEMSLLDKLLEIADRFKELEPWMKHAAVDGKGDAVTKKKWTVLSNRIMDVCKLSEQLDLDAFGKELSVPSLSGKELEDFLSDVSAMYEIRKTGATIGKFKLLCNRSWKRTLSLVSINGKAMTESSDFKIVLDTFALQEKRRDCARYWEQLIQKAGAPGFFDLSPENPESVAKNFVELIKKYTEWYQTDYQPLNELLRCLSIDPNVLFEFSHIDTEIQRTDKIFHVVFNDIRPLVKACKDILLRHEISELFARTKNELGKDERCKSIVCVEMCKAIGRLDVEIYRDAYSALKETYDKYIVLAERKRLLESLRPFAPQWAEAISLRNGIHGMGTPPDNIRNAWRWKQYSAILDDLLAEDYDELQKKITALAKDYRDYTERYIAASAWYHLVKRTEVDHGLKASLTGWARTVQSIGRTNTRRSAQMRQDARRLMARCQKAVPAWIMPISKAMSTLDPIENKFDVVIIDEASQADITTLAIAYMAKKIIIVGDDKQVTPVSVGTPFNKVQALIVEHLKGRVENHHLYNERSSIYDIAGTTYTTLMLMEHFRCVPEIIGFSNMLSYDNRIKPLRDPTTSILLPHVVNYRSSDSIQTGKINKGEAKTIVALMKACIEQEEYNGKTFGVIAMLGSEQAVEIQKLISEYIPLRDIEERQILCGEPPNFQGDERDVVFMSIVSSRTQEAPLSCRRADADMNSLRKRYNVAASRPKDQLWIVHSLDPSTDLQPEDIRKTLLDYSNDPGSFMVEVKSVTERTDSPFEREVAEALMSRGYHIEPQYPVGAYRIDFVAIYKGNKIAFECDGERYHSREEDVRSDMERQQILERMGWQFVRLRGGEYYRNKEKAIDRVVSDFNAMGIMPEKWEDRTKSSPRSSELLERIKSRATVILKEWEEQAKAEKERSEIANVLQKTRRRHQRKEKSEQIDLFGVVETY
jgi:very-short-patch-repair endonuclease